VENFTDSKWRKSLLGQIAVPQEIIHFSSESADSRGRQTE